MFYQERLSVFGLCLFALAGGSWLILLLAYGVSVTMGQQPSYVPTSTGGVLHVLDWLLAAALWLATRRGARRPETLHGLDVGISLALTAVWIMSGAALPVAGGIFIALLSYTTGTLARAIVVPSTARRTALISGLGSAMLIVSASLRTEVGPGGSIAVGCWAVSAAILATLASHTIFGLRREVSEARVLGQYTLESKIGEGGMGSVWRARHALLRRPTAIKLLPPSRMGEEAIKRFEREVQFTARLSHPNNVAIYDYGRTREGIFYYAMEYLEGMDLQKLVAAHGPQPPERVVHVLMQLCSALAEAHDLGLVHRDIKPANVLLSPRRNEHEFAKLVDFGLVKSVELGSHLEGVSSTLSITGTPLYMSPETIRTPDEVGPRSDLYSLGVLAWYMLVGRPPFEGNSVVEVCGKHLHELPQRPSIALGRPIASELEDVVLACLAKQPAERPADARVLRDRLEDCSVADLWSSEQAAAFWASIDVRSTRSVPAAASSPAPRTLALDVHERT